MRAAAILLMVLAYDVEVVKEPKPSPYVVSVKESPKPRATRILCFTASWCVPCHKMKTESHDWLKNAGWQIDETDAANLQLVDVDKREDLVDEYGITTIPTLVLISGDREIARAIYYGKSTYGDMLKKLEKFRRRNDT